MILEILCKKKYSEKKLTVVKIITLLTPVLHMEERWETPEINKAASCPQGEPEPCLPPHRRNEHTHVAGVLRAAPLWSWLLKILPSPAGPPVASWAASQHCCRRCHLLTFHYIQFSLPCFITWQFKLHQAQRWRVPCQAARSLFSLSLQETTLIKVQIRF